MEYASDGNSTLKVCSIRVRKAVLGLQPGRVRVFERMDQNITRDEVKKASKKLDAVKAAGLN